MSMDDFLLSAGICYVRGRCVCRERQVVQQNGDFFYAPVHQAFIFTDAAGGVRRKSGKPTLYVDCPFCGGALMEDS